MVFNATFNNISATSSSVNTNVGLIVNPAFHSFISRILSLTKTGIEV
jgi:hypothetical protein